MINNLETFFNETDKQEVKNAIKEIIINEFKKEISEYGNYIIKPSFISGYLEEALEDIVEELKTEYKNVLLEKILKEDLLWKKQMKKE